MSERDALQPAAGAGAPRPGSSTALWAGTGGIVAAFLGSLCCMGPLLFVTLGVGASLASTFEPLRPAFAVIMLGMFGVAFHAVYGRRRAVSRGRDAETAATCATPRRSRRDQAALWIAVVLAVLLWTFPTWSVRLV